MPFKFILIKTKCALFDVIYVKIPGVNQRKVTFSTSTSTPTRVSSVVLTSSEVKRVRRRQIATNFFHASTRLFPPFGIFFRRAVPVGFPGTAAYILHRFFREPLRLTLFDLLGRTSSINSDTNLREESRILGVFQQSCLDRSSPVPFGGSLRIHNFDLASSSNLVIACLTKSSRRW
jgi:hypothetical protein